MHERGRTGMRHIAAPTKYPIHHAPTQLMSFGVNDDVLGYEEKRRKSFHILRQEVKRGMVQ